MSDRFDDLLGAAYRSSGRSPGNRSGCPSPERLLAAIRGEGPEGERTAVLEHALQCPACRSEMALLHGVSGIAGPTGGSVRPYLTRRWAPWAVAALVLVAVGLGGVRWWQGRVADEVTRDGGGEPALIAPGPGAEVRASEVARFTWRSTAGALRYVVEVTALDGTLLATATTADTTAMLMIPATTIAEGRWWVRVRRDDGSEARSAARALQIR